jgi:type VI secretion system protein ImpL
VLPILIAAFVLIVCILLAWLAGPVFGLIGASLLIARLAFLALGVVVAAVILILYFRQRRRERATAGLPGSSDLDTMLRDAEKRLATAQRSGPKSLDALPLLYVLGEANSAKTTTVLKSGLDPELIAGQIYRDQDVIPTPVANLWYTRSCVLAEAGEAVRKNPALWHKLIRRTRPRVFRSAVGKEAPVRAAVVCISCEQFLGAGASEAAVAAARSTNQLLRDLAQQLGTEIPVYVIFTKLDRVPDFAEYVRNLNSEESTQPVGMALPRHEVPSGVYGEKAMGEVTSSLDQLIFSLGEYRLDLLSRETEQKNIDPVFEFPREMRKMRNVLASYLVELARPSHLNANPYLRGYYFTGVRAQVVEQMITAPAPASHAQPVDAGATRMFSTEQFRGAAAVAAPQVVAQKVAQWCFLPRLFPSVILEDRSALVSSTSSGRTNIFRRVVFACLSLLLLGYLICLTVSWSNNSRLEQSIASAARSLPATTTSVTSLASTQDLSALDQLRAALVRLEDFQRNGPPLSYRWGLYHGDQLLVPARQIYFDHFRRLLLTNTQTNLVATLNALPASSQPGADYAAAYNPLKAYLITTNHPEKSTAEFLTPVLMQYWQNGRTLETDQQRQLAIRQFDFYAAELPRNNPYTIAPETAAVTHARTYLSTFGGFERIYQQMLVAAGKASHAVDFNRDYPGSASTVVDSHIVPAAFTRAGFVFMQDAIQHPDRYFSGEAWVLGDQAPPSLDRANITQQLTARYQQDFTAQWRDFLRAAQVVKYRNLQDAAGKLQLLSNPTSPLLALIYTASHNTAVANPQIAKEFQPTQAVVAPESADKLVGQGNTNYITGLLGLQGAVAQVAQDPTAATNPAAVTPIITAATAAHTAASQTSQAFNLDPQGHVDQVVLALLQAPINSVDEAVRGRGPQQANAAGAGFCSQFAPLMTKFPFAPKSPVDATPAELAGVLQPGSGALWQFYGTTLKPLMIQQGTTYVAAPEAPMKLNPEFLRFFNRAAMLSALLFPGTPGASGLTFNLHILPSNGIQSVTFQLDTERLSGADASKQFAWSPQTSQQAQLIATYATGSLPLLQFSGPWALLRLIDKGHIEQGGNPVRLAYPLEVSNTPIVVNGTPLVVHLELSGPNVALLLPGGLSGMRCVSTVAH